MPVPNLEVTAFIKEPPKFEISDGLVHISQRLGPNLKIESVMRYSLFLKTIALAQKAVRDYEARGQAEVIDFPKREANVAH